MRWLGIIVVAAWSGCSAAGSERATALEPCVVAGLADPARCGTVRVPESANSSRTIDLRVIVLPARSATPLRDPIVPLSGGPGQGSADLAAALAGRYEPFRDQRDVVFIDQRGTGTSNGLQCDERGGTAGLLGRIFDTQQLTQCLADVSRHADVTRYTTSAAAEDYPAAFDQLGYDTVNLVGVSYGSRMGLEIARRFPSRVRALIAEGVVPTTFDWPTYGATDLEAALNAVMDDCEADRACVTTYPRFRQDVDLAFARLRRGPVTATVRDPTTGAIERVPFGDADLAYATRGILYGNDALSLPLWYRQAAEGDFTAFAQAYVSRARSLDASLARGLLLSVYCAEDLPFVNWTAAAQAANGTRTGTFLLDQYRQACAVWPAATIDPAFRHPAQSAVPALLMSGRRDPVTPPRTAIETARTFTRSKVVIWPFGGHGTDGLASADCRTSILDAFLRTADPAAVSTACVSSDLPRPWR
jgi:pimeloyl-ACP methyl ester carboxylesterase